MSIDQTIYNDAKKIARKSPRWFSYLLVLSLCFALGSWAYRSNAQKAPERNEIITKLSIERTRSEQIRADREAAQKESYRLSDLYRKQGDDLGIQNEGTDMYLSDLEMCLSTWLKREEHPCDPSPFLQSPQSSPSSNPAQPTDSPSK